MSSPFSFCCCPAGVVGLVWQQDRDPLVALAQITGISLAAIILLAELGFLIGVSFSTSNHLLALSLPAWGVAGIIRRGFHCPGRPLVSLDRPARVRSDHRLAAVPGQGPASAHTGWTSQHHYLIIRVISGTWRPSGNSCAIPGHALLTTITASTRWQQYIPQSAGWKSPGDDHPRTILNALDRIIRLRIGKSALEGLAAAAQRLFLSPL